jgi:hypothetical protein
MDPNLNSMFKFNFALLKLQQALADLMGLQGPEQGLTLSRGVLKCF